MKFSKRSPSRFFSTCSTSVCAIGLLILLAPRVNNPQTKSISIAVEDDAAPWSRADGSGFANDVVVAAFKSVGVNVDLLVVPYARCKRMALIAEVAACFSMSQAKELEGLIEFSKKPLFSVSSGYFYNVRKPIKVNQAGDLPPQTIVGTVIGYEYPPALDLLKQSGTIILDESPSEEINLRKLAAGRIDLALLNYNDLKTPEFLIEQAGVKGKVQATFLAGRMDSFVGFSKKHPQGDWAREQFNKGFANIAANGRLRRIRATWLRITKP